MFGNKKKIKTFQGMHVHFFSKFAPNKNIVNSEVKMIDLFI